MMPAVLSVAVVLVSFLVAYFTVGWLTRAGHRFQVVDHPNDRSLHTKPTPRIGGIGILLGVLAGLLLFTLFNGTVGLDNHLPPRGWPVVSGVILVLMVSLFDDRFDLPAWFRLVVHIVAAILLIYGGVCIDTIRLPGLVMELPQAASWTITVLFVVWMTNLFNFMDGMDGFAGGMTAFGCLFMALLSFYAGAYSLTMAAMVVAAAACGFLFHNFPPAKIFMGDVGASTLGYLVTIFTVWADKQGYFQLWVSILVFSPFIVDATVTLIKRLFVGEKIWKAHREHYYQRLVQAGWGHRKTVLREYLLMAAVGLLALSTKGLGATGQWVVIAVSILLYAVLAGYVRSLERH